MLRSIALLVFLVVGCSCFVHGQLVDSIIGQKRSRVQAQLKPYRILDYKQEREVHSIEAGIHQTVLFENDTCKRFYWAVTPGSMDRFKVLLLDNGYTKTTKGFVKDNMQLMARELESGSATLFISAVAEERRETVTTKATAKKEPTTAINVSRDKPGKKQLPTIEELQAMPLLQQAILEEEAKAPADSTKRKKKKRNPKDQWVGSSYGEVKLLGF